LRYYEYQAAITKHWLQSEIGPREAAALLQPACSDTQADEEKIRELEALWQKNHDPILIIYGILGDAWHRLAGFDCEDVHSPADHTVVVGYLAAATANKFIVEGVAQTVEPNGNLKLSLTHDGKGYAFTFEDNGSWLNLSGLLAGLNSVLEELCIQERFVELYAGEGPGIVAFVLPNKFLPAAHELGIKLELSPASK
jgi:hypothetical protein